MKKAEIMDNKEKTSTLTNPHLSLRENLSGLSSVYFIGAGGIGMSAIARYFISRGLVVAGYDRTPTELTHQLEKEGMLLHYEESVNIDRKSTRLNSSH